MVKSLNFFDACLERIIFQIKVTNISNNNVSNIINTQVTGHVDTTVGRLIVIPKILNFSLHFVNSNYIS